MAARLSGRRSGLIVLLTCALAACGGSEHATGRPAPPAAGAPLSPSRSKSLSVGPADATLSFTLLGSAGGSLTVGVPAGAVQTRTQFTIDEIGPVTAPGAAGEGFRIGPAGAELLQPLTLTFTPPPGSDIARISAAQQGTTLYWYRHYPVTRDTGGQSLTLQTQAMGDWALVRRDAVQDETGTFTLTSTEAVPYTTTGQLTLEYIGEDAVWDYYIQVGTIAAPASVSYSGLSCTPQPPLALSLPTAVAQIEKGTATFYWSIEGRWQLACTGTSAPLISINFDTFTPTTVGCTRTQDPSSTASPGGAVRGSSSIDCGSGGKRTAAWTLSPAQ